MSIEGLARFDTHTRTRTAQTDEYSTQTELRAIGVREHGQLALNELYTSTQERGTSTAERATTDSSTCADLEAALECVRATIDSLREQVEKLEGERDRLQDRTLSEGDR